MSSLSLPSSNRSHYVALTLTKEPPEQRLIAFKRSKALGEFVDFIYRVRLEVFPHDVMLECLEGSALEGRREFEILELNHMVISHLI
jgi:hypothetical protein